MQQIRKESVYGSMTTHTFLHQSESSSNEGQQKPNGAIRLNISTQSYNIYILNTVALVPLYLYLRLFTQRMLAKLKHRTFRQHQHLVELRRVGSQSFPSPAIWEVGWFSSETACVAIPVARFGDNFHDPMQQSGS